LGGVDLLQRDVTDREALSVLHERHYLELVRLAFVLVDTREAAEEVVQQAFLDVLRRGSFAVDDAAAYLRRAVLNGAKDRLRRRRVRRLWVPLHDVPPAGPEDLALLSDEHRRAVTALKDLPLRQREVLVLRHLTGLSEAETATALGISISAAKSAHHKGISALRARLTAEEWS
jgi:RNA polymerase sigma factor (sigma-70 family)